MVEPSQQQQEDDGLWEKAQEERKHVADMLWAFTAKRSVSKLARKELEEIPGPSLATSFGQLRSLLERSRGLGGLRALPVEIMSWQNPAQTITAMLVYITICLRPQLLACIPLATVLLGVFIPNYARKYPYREEYVPAVAPTTQFDAENIQELIVSRRKEAAERDIIKGVRDSQLSLSKLCEGLAKIDDFKAGPGNFKEPGASCALFLILLFGLVNLAYFSCFIDITQLFIGTGLLVFVVAHPKVKAYLDSLEPLDLELTLMSRIIKKMSSQFEFNDPPITRSVEIFELQRQGLTPRMWDTILFTKTVYTSTSSYRLSQQYPPGSKSLNEVECPPDWSFRDEDVWVEDPDSDKWIHERGIVGLDATGAWGLDVDGDFRRRRLTRCCYYTPV